MTISRNDTGHSRSARTQEETRELLQKELEQLTPGEREALEIAMAQVLSGTEIPELYETIDELEWVQKPVPLEKFCNDPYYLGNTCDTLYARLLDDLRELFKDGTYREAIFTGSIGWGKTFAASIGVCYMLHQLGCMRDPHRSFGIAANSNISVVCLSVNEVLATKVAYENIATKIEASPWFQEHFPFKKTKKELRFPRHIWVAARATTDSSVLGLNVIGGLLDETNFMAKSKGSDPRFNLDGQAQVLYNAMQRRMKSRFERKGQLPGMLFVVSSKQTADDFTAKRIRDSAGDPTIFVRDYSLWDVKPPEYYAGDWFHVIVGSDSTPSRMLKEGEDPEVARDTLAEGCILLPVPEEYRMDFERDLDGAVRDLAGVATVAVSPYINRRQKIEEAINYKRQHPFTSESWDPSQPGRFLWEKMVALRAERDFGDEFSTMNRPIINPSAARHIHIDPSLTGDCTGFAMGHVAGFTEVTRRGDDGGRFAERAPLLCLDAVLRIVPPLGDEIQLGDLRRLIYQLTEKGYVITRVTMDSWQCLAADTLINTARGLVPIVDVIEGDVVQSRSGPRRVSKTWAFGEQETLVVHTSDGDVLEGTGKHRIEAQRGWEPLSVGKYGETKEPHWEWVRLDELVEGDAVRVCVDPVELDVPRFQLHSPDRGEFGFRIDLVEAALSEFRLPSTLDPDLAEVLGLVWGDGDVGKDGCRLTVTEQDAGCAQDVFERVFGVRPAFRQSESRATGTIGVFGRWFVRWMTRNGLVKPDVPEAILRSPRDVQAAFLRGLFAADGNVKRSDGAVSLSTCSLEMAQNVRLMLRTTLGIQSTLVVRPGTRRGRYPTEKQHQYVVCARGSRADFLDRVGFSYASKRGQLEKHRDVRGRRIFTRVSAIEQSSAEVFDLTVEEDPSYLAGGIVSHNSAEAIQKLNQKGYNAEVLSVDRTMSPYEVMKEALYDGRLELYDYPPLIRELRELEHDRIKRKVDHPARGSKDVADALAGICYSLTENSLNQPMPFVRSTPMYSGDAWMQEQIQHSMASASRRDMETSGEGAPDGGLLPAFLVGSGGGNNWEE